MTSPFEAARSVSAMDVALREGIALRRRGSRAWACCPLHGEKTPSLCFYPDGRWYCFGCHRGGDAVDFLAALRGMERLEAARMLAGNPCLPRQHPPPPAPRRAPFLSRSDEDGFTWDRLCRIRHAAAEIIAGEQADTPRLWEAVAALSAAEERLDNLLAGELPSDNQRNGGINGKL